MIAINIQEEVTIRNVDFFYLMQILLILKEAERHFFVCKDMRNDREVHLYLEYNDII